MRRDRSAIVLPLLAAAALLVGLGYLLGRARTDPEPAANPAAARRSLPAGHPSLQGSDQLAQQREGKVSVDPARAFTHFRVGNKNVKRIFADGGVMWVGTSGGLVRYDTRTDEFKLYDTGNGLLSNGVFYVGRLGGRIAVGTYGGGLSLLDEATQKWKTYNVPQGLGDAFVYDVLATSDGDVWIATWSGANRVRGGALDDRSRWDLFTVESTKGGLPNDWVYGLAEGRDGDIWLATEGGLARYRKGKWDRWRHGDGLGAPYEKVKNDIDFRSDPSKVSRHHAKQKKEMGLQGVDVAYNPNYIVSMAVDRDGVVWAGTWGAGLARFDGRRWTNYTKAEGLPGNHVFMLKIDPSGRLWIGTNNGLAKMSGDGFEVMTVADGLFSNAVFAMTTDADGSIWVGSFGGVAHIRQPRIR